ASSLLRRTLRGEGVSLFRGMDWIMIGLLEEPVRNLPHLPLRLKASSLPSRSAGRRHDRWRSSPTEPPLPPAERRSAQREINGDHGAGHVLLDLAHAQAGPLRDLG